MGRYFPLDQVGRDLQGLSTSTPNPVKRCQGCSSGGARCQPRASPAKDCSRRISDPAEPVWRQPSGHRLAPSCSRRAHLTPVQPLVSAGRRSLPSHSIVRQDHPQTVHPHRFPASSGAISPRKRRTLRDFANAWQKPFFFFFLLLLLTRRKKTCFFPLSFVSEGRVVWRVVGFLFVYHLWSVAEQ